MTNILVALSNRAFSKTLILLYLTLLRGNEVNAVNNEHVVIKERLGDPSKTEEERDDIMTSDWEKRIAAVNNTAVSFDDETIWDAVEEWLDDKEMAKERYGDINTWDVSNVTDMSYLLSVGQFNDDISLWDTSSVTSMKGMFSGAILFNGDLSAWNMTSVTTMDYMFYEASSFNGDLSRWDMPNANSMVWMFYEASSFNGDVSGWDTSSVTNMSDMFDNAISFNRDVSGWNTSSVDDMSFMFANAVSFNGDVSGWDKSRVSSMYWMFNMEKMFANAVSFNQTLCWDLLNDADVSGMFCRSNGQFNPNCVTKEQINESTECDYDYAGFALTGPSI